MVSTSHGDVDQSRQSLVPRSKLFWAGFIPGVALLLIGATVATGSLAAILGIWGITLLLMAVGGYGFYRVWYSVSA